MNMIASPKTKWESIDGTMTKESERKYLISTSGMNEIVPGQFDDASERQEEDAGCLGSPHLVLCSRSERPLPIPSSTIAMVALKSRACPRECRDIVLGIKSSKAGSTIINSESELSQRLSDSQKTQSLEVPTKQTTRSSPMRYVLPVPIGKKRSYIPICPKPVEKEQSFSVVTNKDPWIPPFIYTNSPKLKRPKLPKSPPVRLDELDQHPHVMLLPDGVAPILQSLGYTVMGVDRRATSGARSSVSARKSMQSRAILEIEETIQRLPLHCRVEANLETRIHVPLDRDILLGRSNKTHVGNEFFRQVLAKYKGAYRVAAKGDKKLLVMMLLNYFRIRNCRFLLEVKSSDKNIDCTWYHEAGNIKAMDKVSQTLRGGTHPPINWKSASDLNIPMDLAKMNNSSDLDKDHPTSKPCQSDHGSGYSPSGSPQEDLIAKNRVSSPSSGFVPRKKAVRSFP